MTQETKWTVKDLDVDLWNYYSETFFFRYVDYQVITEYVDEHTYNIIVRRIDCDAGWRDDLKVLIYNDLTKDSVIVNIPNQPNNECIIKMHDTNVFIQPSTTPFIRLPVMNLPNVPQENRVDKDTFNKIFPNANVRHLPKSLFAVGLNKKALYLHNIDYSQYVNIRQPIHHLIQVALKYDYDNFHFIISSSDGFMESTYVSLTTRDNLKEVNTPDVSDLNIYIPDSDDEMPIFHNGLTILAQSMHNRGLPYVTEIVDRHYFYHNLYHSFRSFHQGIPFSNKINKIVYGGQARDTLYNFDKYRDILKMPPRVYFRDNVAPLHSFIHCPNGWIDRKVMAENYKYILNIDGLASCYDATAWLLNSGSVIFKPKSVWRQWFYDDFMAGVHYIELEEDFKDIEEKWLWCESHQEECELMIRRCKTLFQTTYNYTNIVEYTRRTLKNVQEGH